MLKIIKEEKEREIISYKYYDGDEYIASVINDMLEDEGYLKDGEYIDYVTQVKEIKYSNGEIEYCFQTTRFDGAYTKQEVDKYIRQHYNN